MALIFCDSFDHYTTVTQKWVNSSSVVTPTIGAVGKNSTNGLTHSYSSSSNAFLRVRRDLPSTYNTLIMGTAFKCTNLDDDTNWGRDCIQAAINGSFQFSVTSNAAGQLEFRRGNWNGSIMQTSGALITPNIWYWLEVKVYIHDTAGTYEVKLNNTTVLSGTNVDTKASASAGANQVWLSGFAYNRYTYWDDLYVCDTTGDFANDFLTDGARVVSLLPSGAGNYSNWTPSAGSNYECVDEVPPNGDTDYVSAATSGIKDSYAFGDLPISQGYVLGVQYSVFGKKTAGGVEQFKPLFRPASTDYEGTLTALTDSYAYHTVTQNENPETAAQWTISEVNSAEFGIKSET